MENNANTSNIADLLGTGRANAIPSRILCAMTGLNKRELRRAVSNARLNGTPICSSPDGYFFPESVDEITASVREIRARLLPTFRAVAALEKAAEGFTQETMIGR